MKSTANYIGDICTQLDLIMTMDIRQSVNAQFLNERYSFTCTENILITLK